jgi:cell division protein FtsB
VQLSSTVRWMQNMSRDRRTLAQENSTLKAQNTELAEQVEQLQGELHQLRNLRKECEDFARNILGQGND